VFWAFKTVKRIRIKTGSFFIIGLRL